MIMKILFTDDSVLIVNVSAYEDVGRDLKLVMPDGRIRYIEKYEACRSIDKSIYHPGIKLYKDDTMIQFVTQPKQKSNVFKIFESGDKS